MDSMHYFKKSVFDFKKSVFVVSMSLLVVFTGTAFSEESLSDAAKLVDEIVKEVPATSILLQNRPAGTFSDKELLIIVNTFVSQYATQLSLKNGAKLSAAGKILVMLLKKYKVTGCSFCVDPNAAFIWDNQNPKFNVMYKK